MRISIVSLTTLTAVLMSSTITYAGTIKTPNIVRSNQNDQGVVCAVANTTTKSVGPFNITIIDEVGDDAASANNVTLGAGGSASLPATDLQLDGSQVARCVVEGKGISKNKTPVTLCVVNAMNADCQAAVSVP